MKKAKMILMTVMFMVLFAVTAFAAESKIERVNVSVNETKMEPGVVWTAEVSVNSSDYHIEKSRWSSDYEFWNPGKKVTLEVTLISDTGSFGKDPYVYGYNCEKVSVSRSGSKKLKLKFNYIPRVTLSIPTGIHYEDEYLLAWDRVEYAGGYKVELYRDGSYHQSVSLEGRNTTEFDLSEYATDDYLVTTKIKAVAPSGKGYYISDSEWVAFDDEGVSVDSDSTTTGRFQGSGTSKRFYDEYDDGNYKTEWQYINGYWYFFRPENGYALTDCWLNTGGQWYLFDSDGRMLTGWRKTDGYWYYLNPSDATHGVSHGAMKTGWIQTSPGGCYYYLNPGNVEGIPFGAMIVDRMTPDGYYVNQNGEWLP